MLSIKMLDVIEGHIVASQKGVIIATIVAALITAGVTLYVYFDGKNNGYSATETTNQNSQHGDEGEKIYQYLD